MASLNPCIPPLNPVKTPRWQRINCLTLLPNVVLKVPYGESFRVNAADPIWSSSPNIFNYHGIYTNVDPSEEEIAVLVTGTNFTDLNAHLNAGDFICRTVQTALPPAIAEPIIAPRVINNVVIQQRDVDIWEKGFRYTRNDGDDAGRLSDLVKFKTFVYFPNDQLQWFYMSLIDNNIQSTFQEFWHFQGANVSNFFGYFTIPSGKETALSKLPREVGFPFFARDSLKLYVHSGDADRVTEDERWGFDEVVSKRILNHDPNKDPQHPDYDASLQLSPYLIGDVVFGELVGVSKQLRQVLDPTWGLWRRDLVPVWRRFEPYALPNDGAPHVFGPDDEFYITTGQAPSGYPGIYKNISNSPIAITLGPVGAPTVGDLQDHLDKQTVVFLTQSNPSLPTDHKYHGQTVHAWQAAPAVNNYGDFVFDNSPPANYDLYQYYYMCNYMGWSSPTFIYSAEWNGWTLLADVFDVRDYHIGRRSSYIHVSNLAEGRFPLEGKPDTIYIDISSEPPKFYFWHNGKYNLFSQNYPYVEKIWFVLGGAEDNILPRLPEIHYTMVDFDSTAKLGAEEIRSDHRTVMRSVEQIWRYNAQKDDDPLSLRDTTQTETDQVTDIPRLSLQPWIMPLSSGSTMYVDLDFNAKYVQQDEVSEAADPDADGILNTPPALGGGMNVYRIFRIPDDKKLHISRFFYRGKNNVKMELNDDQNTLTFSLPTNVYLDRMYLREHEDTEYTGAEILLSEVVDEQRQEKHFPIQSTDHRFKIVPKAMQQVDPDNPPNMIDVEDGDGRKIFENITFDLDMRYVELMYLRDTNEYDPDDPDWVPEGYEIYLMQRDHNKGDNPEDASNVTIRTLPLGSIDSRIALHMSYVMTEIEDPNDSTQTIEVYQLDHDNRRIIGAVDFDLYMDYIGSLDVEFREEKVDASPAEPRYFNSLSVDMGFTRIVDDEEDEGEPEEEETDRTITFIETDGIKLDIELSRFEDLGEGDPDDPDDDVPPSRPQQSTIKFRNNIIYVKGETTDDFQFELFDDGWKVVPPATSGGFIDVKNATMVLDVRSEEYISIIELSLEGIQNSNIFALPGQAHAEAARTIFLKHEVRPIDDRVFNKLLKPFEFTDPDEFYEEDPSDLETSPITAKGFTVSITIGATYLFGNEEYPHDTATVTLWYNPPENDGDNGTMYTRIMFSRNMLLPFDGTGVPQPQEIFARIQHGIPFAGDKRVTENLHYNSLQTNP